MQSDAGTRNLVTDPGDNARIGLRSDHFDLVTNMLGHTTWQAKAAFVGVDPATLSRARRGENISDRFVARTLVALGRHRDWFTEKNTLITFEALFDACPAIAPERAA